MVFEDMKGWVDFLVRNHKELEAAKGFGGQARVCVNDFIVVFDGIGAIADCLGMELKEEVSSLGDGSGWPYRYSFSYQGISFVQPERERMGSKDGGD